MKKTVMKKAATGVLPVTLLFAATMVVTTTSASAGDLCTSRPYPTSDQAKSGFAVDCGRPFEQTPAHRCDWTPAGWECQGPGSSATSRKRPKLPTLEEMDSKSDAKNLNNRLYQDTRDRIGEQYDAVEHEFDRLEAEKLDRQIREAQIERERVERARRNAEQRRREQARRDHTSTQDENQRSDGTRGDGSGGATRSGDAGDGLRG